MFMLCLFVAVKSMISGFKGISFGLVGTKQINAVIIVSEAIKITENS